MRKVLPNYFSEGNSNSLFVTSRPLKALKHGLQSPFVWATLLTTCSLAHVSVNAVLPGALSYASKGSLVLKSCLVFHAVVYLFPKAFPLYRFEKALVLTYFKAYFWGADFKKWADNVIVGRAPLTNRDHIDKLTQSHEVKRVISVVSGAELEHTSLFGRVKGVLDGHLHKPLSADEPPTVEEIHRVVEEIGEVKTYIHCLDGGNRSKLVAACHLIKTGVDLADVLARCYKEGLSHNYIGRVREYYSHKDAIDEAERQKQPYKVTVAARVVFGVAKGTFAVLSTASEACSWGGWAVTLLL